jgi:DNA-binding MarR family transcriptional regulator
MTHTIKMTKLVNRLITVDPDLSVTKLAVLLEVYNAGQTTPSKLADELHLTLATASRHLAYWSAWNRQRKVGKGAIEYNEDRMDRRIRYVSCTDSGKKLVKSLVEEL